MHHDRTTVAGYALCKMYIKMCLNSRQTITNCNLMENDVRFRSTVESLHVLEIFYSNRQPMHTHTHSHSVLSGSVCGARILIVQFYAGAHSHQLGFIIVSQTLVKQSGISNGKKNECNAHICTYDYCSDRNRPHPSN